MEEDLQHLYLNFFAPFYRFHFFCHPHLRLHFVIHVDHYDVFHLVRH
jgi:hypothetical protein